MKRSWGRCIFWLLVGCGGNVQHRGADAGPASTGVGGTPMGGTPSSQAGVGSTPPTKPDPETGGAVGTGGAGGRGGSASIPEGGEAQAQGGTDTGPCTDIEGTCTPGATVCHPRLGELTTCTECGQPSEATTGKPCVRLLAADKESTAVCVVRGQTNAECRRSWGAVNVRQVPPETDQLLVPDDSQTLDEGLARLCVHIPGGYSCISGGKRCVAAAVGDGSVCALCDGALRCEGDATFPQAKAPLAVTITDSSAFVLTPDGVQGPIGGLPVPAGWDGKPALLAIDHQFAGCMASNEGELLCWLDYPSPENAKPSPWHRRIRKLAPQTMPRMCVLWEDGYAGCGDVMTGTPTWLSAAPVQDLVASNNLVCTLSADGHVSCWDGAAKPLEMPDNW